tara:strand:+ start:1453 stop:1572 length:120 start_codon:yes stop_codon:yes gene_type:complete
LKSFFAPSIKVDFKLRLKNPTKAFTAIKKSASDDADFLV